MLWKDAWGPCAVWKEFRHDACPGSSLLFSSFIRQNGDRILLGRRRDEFSYRIGLQTTTETASSISRDYIVNSENKNNTNMFSEIKDENIEYISDLYGDIEK